MDLDTPFVAEKPSPAEKNAERVSTIPPQSSYESRLAKLYAGGTLEPGTHVAWPRKEPRDYNLQPEPGTHVGWPRKEPRDYNLQPGFTPQYISEALKRKWQDEDDDRRRKAAAAQKLVDEDKAAFLDLCPRCCRPLYRGRRCQNTQCPQYAGIYVGMGEW